MMALHSDTAGRARVLTSAGVGIVRRRPRRWKIFHQLVSGPFLAGFEAGMYDLRDIAGDLDYAHLTTEQP
jgi:hypothetical protein